MTAILATADDSTSTTQTTRALVRYLDRVESTVIDTIRWAVGRSLKSTSGRAAGITAPDQLTLANSLAGPLAVANLLGRRQIGLQLDEALQEVETFNEPDVAAYSIEQLTKLLTPQAALDYFRRLIPIQLSDSLFGALITGQAFSIAATTDQTVRRMVAKVLDERLETGKRVSGAQREIEEILDEAGVSHRRGYGELVARTNLMEAYRHGAWEEFNKPAVAAMFPVWKYSGIADGRERMGPMPEKPDHHRWFGKYFERSVDFFRVRGTAARDVINCRCNFIGINKYKWRRLQAQGAKTEPWPQ
jgi:hypothetical protein